MRGLCIFLTHIFRIAREVVALFLGHSVIGISLRSGDRILVFSLGSALYFSSADDTFSAPFACSSQTSLALPFSVLHCSLAALYSALIRCFSAVCSRSQSESRCG
jgi:hypothetical protein